MTLKDARALKAYIHSKYSINCTVPLGRGPSGYFPQSILITGAHDWTSKQQFRDWLAKRRRDDRATMRAYLNLTQRRIRPARSPLEMMIDRACGLA